MLAITPISAHHLVQNNTNKYSQDGPQQEKRAEAQAMQRDLTLAKEYEKHVAPPSVKAYLLDALFATMGGEADYLARGHYLDTYI